MESSECIECKEGITLFEFRGEEKCHRRTFTGLLNTLQAQQGMLE
jgi:hypothetical protein